MNYIIIISFIAMVLFALVFAFPRNVLAMVHRKENNCPECFEDSEVLFVYFVSGLFFFVALIVLFSQVSGLS